MANKVLWWGRFDPDYSRNRVLRASFLELGWEVVDYHPRISALGGLGASRLCEKPDLVWVPCFRQRDVLAACRWARRRGIPVVFDPLISAYDKQVFERKVYSPGSLRARQLLHRECRQFGSVNLLVADTQAHADYFSDQLQIQTARLHVVPVGAEESLFRPCRPGSPENAAFIEVLFYGSFITLQNPQMIIKAAQLCRTKNVVWTLLGSGPELTHCQQLVNMFQLKNVRFEPWLSYPELPQRICQADILLGIFGRSDKASRVIPNKVYQSLACGRPVITRSSSAYPVEQPELFPHGLYQIEPDAPKALAGAIETLCSSPEKLQAYGVEARAIYEQYFSSSAINASLQNLLKRVSL